MKKGMSGFTLVELLIVIVVIAILATISVVAYSGIQLRARDADRASDISQLQRKLEMYYAINSTYPSSRDMESASFRRNNLDIQDDGLVSISGSTYTIRYCWPGVTTHYCYGGRLNGGDCVPLGSQCTGYWIIYRTEADPNTNIFISQNY